jgi:hypothetical protein
MDRKTWSAARIYQAEQAEIERIYCVLQSNLPDTNSGLLSVLLIELISGNHEALAEII